MLIYLFVEIFILIIMIYMLFYLISYKIFMDSESMNSYECGFDIMSNTRVYFSYRFFLISILFLIFDVEISLMLPIPYMLGLMGLWVFILFILVLILGLMYEYYCGSLEWMN